MDVPAILTAIDAALADPRRTAPEPRHTALEPHHTALEPHHTALEPHLTALEPHHTALEPHHTAAPARSEGRRAWGPDPRTAAPVAREHTNDASLLAVCEVLADGVPHYDWVGFYLVDPSSPRELVLGPYVGAPTEHTRIPFGAGICGQAAERRETFVVQDVSEETNYLSCSVHVRSEMVVPIIAGDRVLGELDIDSHALRPFGDEDRALLEAIAGRVASLLSGEESTERR